MLAEHFLLFFSLPHDYKTIISPWTFIKGIQCPTRPQCIAASAVSGGTEGREPVVLVISLQSLHSAKHIYSSDSRLGGSDAGGNFCIRNRRQGVWVISGEYYKYMQIKTNKRHCVWTKVAYHVVSVHQICCYLSILHRVRSTALCVIAAGHFVATNWMQVQTPSKLIIRRNFHRPNLVRRALYES